MNKFLITILSLFLVFNLNAQSEDAPADSIDIESIETLLIQDSILKSFKYQTGQVDIGDKLATITVPKGCLYLEPVQASYLMVEILGNPPGEGSLGILLSDTPSMLGGLDWLIEYHYVNDGHVMDDDAKDINYDELLKQMKKETEEESIARVKEGYEGVKLIGWAQSPFYDEKEKKLHWAKELVFGENEEHTLNYNIRVLGREGFLEMNIISGMDGFELVKKDIPEILLSTNFKEGYRYSDYNESTDKLAEYGIGGLIAGGILAKTGILTKIGIFLLKFIKPIIVGVIALFGFLGKRFFNRRKEQKEELKAEDSE